MKKSTGKRSGNANPLSEELKRMADEMSAKAAYWLQKSKELSEAQGIKDPVAPDTHQEGPRRW